VSPICTDNVLFSQVDAPEEYARVAALPGMTAEKMARTIRYGREAAFRRG
jgi:adenosine deaminase